MYNEVGTVQSMRRPQMRLQVFLRRCTLSVKININRTTESKKETKSKQKHIKLSLTHRC